jgi:hypothetical protein
VDLGGSPTPASANGLGIGPPFPPALQRCAFAVVLSMHCRSAASNLTIMASIVCQMPSLDQRLKRL